MSDFKVKMHQIQIGWGSAPDLLAGFKGPTSQGGERKGWEMERGKGRARERRGKVKTGGRKGKGEDPSRVG